MADPTTVVCEPEVRPYWPGYRPGFYPYAWDANVKHTYDQYGPYGAEMTGRGYVYADNKDERDSDFRDSRDERDSDIRASKNTVDAALLAERQLLTQAYLKAADSNQTAILLAIYDNLTDARQARGRDHANARLQEALLYNLQVTTAMENETAKQAMEMAEVSLQALLGQRQWGQIYPTPSPA